MATRDFGDLPDSYRTTYDPANPTGPSTRNGARHEIVAGFSLGSKIDGEQNGQPSVNADGDNLGDEDGVVLLGAAGNPTGAIVPNATNSVQVTINGVGGYLNAWFDFNRNGTFENNEHAIVDEDLNPGVAVVNFPVPNVVGGPIAARFRWGTAGLDYFGPAIIGEVEDYFFANSVSPPTSGSLPGDYDANGTVNQADYSVWFTNFGSTTNLAADGNHNGIVDSVDYSIWRDHLGHSSGGAGAGNFAASERTIVAQFVARAHGS